MDTKDINISKSEEEALKIMEDTSSVTSGQIQSLKEDEECMQICSDMAELTIEMQKAKNTLAIDIQKELADFHRKHSEDNKHRKNTSLFWISFAGVAATVIVVQNTQQNGRPLQNGDCYFHRNRNIFKSFRQKLPLRKSLCR